MNSNNPNKSENSVSKKNPQRERFCIFKFIKGFFKNFTSRKLLIMIFSFSVVILLAYGFYHLSINSAKLNFDELKDDELNFDEVKDTEVKVDELKVDELNFDEVNFDEVKVDEVKVDEVKVDEVKVDEVKVDELKVVSKEKDAEGKLNSLYYSGRLMADRIRSRITNFKFSRFN